MERGAPHEDQSRLVVLRHFQTQKVPKKFSDFFVSDTLTTTWPTSRARWGSSLPSGRPKGPSCRREPTRPGCRNRAGSLLPARGRSDNLRSPSRSPGPASRYAAPVRTRNARWSPVHPFLPEQSQRATAAGASKPSRGRRRSAEGCQTPAPRGKRTRPPGDHSVDRDVIEPIHSRHDRSPHSGSSVGQTGEITFGRHSGTRQGESRVSPLAPAAPMIQPEFLD